MVLLEPRGVMLVSFGESKRRATGVEYRRIRTFPSCV